MKRRYTNHGKKRVIERVDTNLKSSTLVHNASQYGKSINEYKGKFKQYLLSKDRPRNRIKIYNNNLFVFSKNSKRLITVYPVPEKYIPLEKYEVAEEILSLNNKLKTLSNFPVVVELKNKGLKSGYLEITEELDKVNYFILKTDIRSEKIKKEDVKDVRIDEKTIYEEMSELFAR